MYLSSVYVYTNMDEREEKKFIHRVHMEAQAVTDYSKTTSHLSANTCLYMTRATMESLAYFRSHNAHRL